MSESLNHCYDLLNKTGRAFGLTINFLNEELRDALCVYYLVQRAVDTVEDDMTIPSDIRVTMLMSFDKYLRDPTWKYAESNDEYAIVLANFPYITQALHQLPKKYSDIILECAAHTGMLMTTFVGKEFASIEDINEYCRKVTFLNSTGLLDLFVAAELEEKRLDMSLLVESYMLIQKTNILRDFSKDWSSGRLYYPRDVMAIATIELCYNKPEVLTESVKIGREETVEIIESASSMRVIAGQVRFFTERIMDQTHHAKGRTHNTLDMCRQIVTHIEQLQLS